MKKFIGKIYFHEGEHRDQIFGSYQSVSIKRAILNDKILKIEYFNPEGSSDVLINLKSKDGFEFAGSAKAPDEEKFTGKINFNFYSNNDKALLIGTWAVGNLIDTCIIELEEVDQFKD